MHQMLGDRPYVLSREGTAVLLDFDSCSRAVRVDSTTLTDGTLSVRDIYRLKQSLVKTLVFNPDGTESPKAGSEPARSDRTGALLLTTDELGCPRARISGEEHVSVSFSRCMDRLWACVCRGRCSVGIDASCASEFPDRYPVHRAFHQNERNQLMGRYGLSSQEVTAMVWSVKEAVVKALGCGFRLIDPLDVAVEWVGMGTAGDWSIRLLSTARKRLATRNDFRVQARTFRLSTQFVSVAITAQ